MDRVRPSEGGCYTLVRALLAVALSAALLVDAGGAAQTSLKAITAGAADAITFSTPTLADADHANGEPDIGIDPQGRVLSSRPTGTRTQPSMGYGPRAGRPT